MSRTPSVALLAASILSLAGIAPAAGAPIGHLYVATEGKVARYPLVAGFPATVPDLVIPNVSDPVAVGSDGTVYATVDEHTKFHRTKIDVFPPGSTTASRRLLVPYVTGAGNEAAAIAIGPYNFVYISYYDTYSGARPHSDAGNATAPKIGIAVYGPKSTGTPFRAYALPNDASGAQGLAFSPAGELYATDVLLDGSGVVDVITDPRFAPHVTRQITGAELVDPTGIAFDGSGYFYVLATGAYGKESDVLTFPTNANGPTPPTRTLELLPQTYGYYGLDTYGPNVFLQVPASNAVFAFPKKAIGTPYPVNVLRVDKPQDITFGP